MEKMKDVKEIAGREDEESEGCTANRRGKKNMRKVKDGKEIVGG